MEKTKMVSAYISDQRLLDKLKARCEADERSMSWTVVHALREYIEKREADDGGARLNGYEKNLGVDKKTGRYVDNQVDLEDMIAQAGKRAPAKKRTKKK